MTDLAADERVFKFYTDVEQDLRAAVRAAVEEKCPLSVVARRIDTPDPRADAALWTLLGRDLGLAGLLVPEAFGGAGATAREAAVVLEELGRGVVPVPFVTSAVWSAVLLGAANDVEPVPDHVLRALGSGAVCTVAAPVDIVPGAAFPSQVAADPGELARDVTLTGAVRAVIGAEDAPMLIVPARIGDRAALVLVNPEAESAEFSRTTTVSLDESRPLCELVFAGCPGTVLVTDEDAESAFERSLVVTAALLASEQLGVAERCLEETVAYAKTRHQFGRTIGSFQVVKHRLADLWTQIEGARTAARYAATCAALDSDDLPIASALAAAYCAEAAVKAAEECVQLHGGIGFTWEHPAHLWLKRAMAQSVMFGGADGQRTRLAELLDLPPA